MRMRNPTVEIRQSYDNLISTMKISTLMKHHFLYWTFDTKILSYHYRKDHLISTMRIPTLIRLVLYWNNPREMANEHKLWLLIRIHMEIGVILEATQCIIDFWRSWEMALRGKELQLYHSVRFVIIPRQNYGFSWSFWIKSFATTEDCFKILLWVSKCESICAAHNLYKS